MILIELDYSSIMELTFLVHLQDVAVKVFSRQEYSDKVIYSFRQEVGCKIEICIFGFEHYYLVCFIVFYYHKEAELYVGKKLYVATSMFDHIMFI